MLLNIFRETPSNPHGPRHNIVYVLMGAEAHGVERVEPEPFTCDCGVALTSEKMESDPGDWKAKCTECDSYVRPSAEEQARAEGYKWVPSDERERIKSKAREEALEKLNNNCVTGEEEASHVKRIVPPRYGGNGDVENLVALCEHHHDDFGHKFVDILNPAEWYKIEGGDWHDVATSFRSTVDPEDAPDLAARLDTLLKSGQPENPYPYAGR